MRSRRRVPLILSLAAVAGSQSQAMHEPWMEIDLPFPLFQRVLAEEGTTEICEPLSQCEMCTDAQRKDQEECKVTSRIQHFSCRPDKEDKTAAIKLVKSCARTAADEEFLMTRLQVMCFLLGSISLMMVRRQKSSATSLFDQRKAIGPSKRNPQQGVEMVGQPGSEPNIHAVDGDEFASLTSVGTPSKPPSEPLDIV